MAEKEKKHQRLNKRPVVGYRPPSPEDRLRVNAAKRHYEAETKGAKRRAELNHRNYI